MSSAEARGSCPKRIVPFWCPVPAIGRLFPEIGVLRQQVRLAADMVQQMAQLARQDLVRPEIVRSVMQPDAAVAVDQDPVVRVRQILAGEPEIECVARQLVRRNAGQQMVRLALEHRRVGLAEHLDMAERQRRDPSLPK